MEPNRRRDQNFQDFPETCPQGQEGEKGKPFFESIIRATVSPSGHTIVSVSSRGGANRRRGEVSEVMGR